MFKGVLVEADQMGIVRFILQSNQISPKYNDIWIEGSGRDGTSRERMLRREDNPFVQPSCHDTFAPSLNK